MHRDSTARAIDKFVLLVLLVSLPYAKKFGFIAAA
jgi:hypothetical protein